MNKKNYKAVTSQLTSNFTISYTLSLSCKKVTSFFNSSFFFWESFNRRYCCSSSCCWSWTCCFRRTSSAAALLWGLRCSVSLAWKLKTERTFNILNAEVTVSEQTSAVLFCWLWLSVPCLHFRGLRSAGVMTGRTEPWNYLSNDSSEKAGLVREIRLRPQGQEKWDRNTLLYLGDFADSSSNLFCNTCYQTLINAFRYWVSQVSYCWIIKHHGQSKLGRRGLICPLLPLLSSSSKEVKPGTQTGQAPGGRSWHTGMEDCCLVACSSMFAQPAFLEKTGLPPQDGITHPGLSPPSPINH